MGVRGERHGSAGRPAGDADGLIVLGGDGTFLRAARAWRRSTCPSWASTAAGRLPVQDRADRTRGDVWQIWSRTTSSIEPRMMLEATLLPGGDPAARARRILRGAQRCGGRARLAGTRGAPGRQRSMPRTWPPTSPMASWSARRPARPRYSFSAGGPILDPTSRNLVVTSIAAYLLGDPIVRGRRRRTRSRSG